MRREERGSPRAESAGRPGDVPIQVRKLEKKRRTLEDNMSRLYEAAKAKIDERSQVLSAARLRAATVHDRRGAAGVKRAKTA